MIRVFLSLVEIYCRTSGLAEATVSTRIFNDGKAIEQIRKGRDVGVNRLDTAVRWLSDNWPAKTPWPAGVSRPARTMRAAS